MKHETFIHLYLERTVKNTWEAWRKRHADKPMHRLLGSLPHATACKLPIPQAVGSNIEALREFLLARYDSASPCVLKPQHDIPPRVVIAMLNASGFDWFTKDDRFYIHWTHRLKEQHEQVKEAV